MTQAKKSNLWNLTRTILSGVSTTFIVAGFYQLVAMHDFMISTRIKDADQDAQLILFRVDIGVSEKANARQDNDITALFGMMPDDKKRKYNR